jgi:hypothetical protein
MTCASTAGYQGFFFGVCMSIFLKAELETEVVGHGDGWISFTQTLPHDEKVEIWLSVNQFEIIFNLEKHIVREALGTE